VKQVTKINSAPSHRGHKILNYWLQDAVLTTKSPPLQNRLQKPEDVAVTWDEVTEISPMDVFWSAVMPFLANLLSVAVPIFSFLFKKFEDQWLIFSISHSSLNLLLHFLGGPDHRFRLEHISPSKMISHVFDRGHLLRTALRLHSL
jgi:hypothetical protein